MNQDSETTQDLHDSMLINDLKVILFQAHQQPKTHDSVLLMLKSSEDGHQDCIISTC